MRDTTATYPLGAHAVVAEAVDRPGCVEDLDEIILPLGGSAGSTGKGRRLVLCDAGMHAIPGKAAHNFSPPHTKKTNSAPAQRQQLETGDGGGGRLPLLPHIDQLEGLAEVALCKMARKVLRLDLANLRPLPGNLRKRGM